MCAINQNEYTSTEYKQIHTQEPIASSIPINYGSTNSNLIIEWQGNLRKWHVVAICTRTKNPRNTKKKTKKEKARKQKRSFRHRSIYVCVYCKNSVSRFGLDISGWKKNLHTHHAFTYLTQTHTTHICKNQYLQYIQMIFHSNTTIERKHARYLFQFRFYFCLSYPSMFSTFLFANYITIDLYTRIGPTKKRKYTEKNT